MKSYFKKLKKMHNGWLDGDGLAPNSMGLDWLQGVFLKNYPGNLPQPCIYPTVEGNVQVEWSLNDSEITMVVNLSTHIAEWQAVEFGTAGPFDEYTINLDDDSGWKKIIDGIKIRLSIEKPS